MQRRTPHVPKYRNGDLLTMEQAADAFGYSKNYMQRLTAPSCPEYDEDFARMRVNTDAAYRKAFRTSALYVYLYEDLVQWFTDHVGLPNVRRYNESRGIIVE